MSKASSRGCAGCGGCGGCGGSTGRKAHTATPAPAATFETAGPPEEAPEPPPAPTPRAPAPAPDPAPEDDPQEPPEDEDTTTSTTDCGCDCDIEILPFICWLDTCECPDYVRSEGCGIRFDPTGPPNNDGGPDNVYVGYQAVTETGLGTYEVTRFLPDQIVPVSAGDLDTGGDCDEVDLCLVAFEVQAVPRPGIPFAGALVPLSTFNKTALRSNSINLTNPPQLEPFTRREQYRIVVSGDEPDCDDTLELPVWDCDLIRKCYEVSYHKARLDYYGPTAPFSPKDMTFREFAAVLGANGALALCRLYYQSATNCLRQILNVSWTANMSAVLAEDFYKAFVQNHNLDPAWAAFFALPDIEITSLTFYWNLKSRSDAFAKAHTLGGIKKALAVMGASQCCPDDLDTVVDTLVAAQTPILNKFSSLFPFGSTIAGWVGYGPVDQFRDSLRQAIIDALSAAGMTDCMNELKHRWGL